MGEKDQLETGRKSGNGEATLTPADVHRLFEDGYREVEVLADGTVRERNGGADAQDETVTRTLKTERTWY